MNKAIFTICFVLLSLSAALAQTTYTSVQDGEYSNSSTWSPTGVPGDADNVIINHAVRSSSSLEPGDNTTNTVSFTINSTGELTVNGSRFDLMGEVNFTNSGSLVARDFNVSGPSVNIINNGGTIGTLGANFNTASAGFTLSNTNNGTILFGEGIDIRSATITNDATSTLTFNTDVDVFPSTGITRFRNSGIVNVPDIDFSDIEFTNNETGTVNVTNTGARTFYMGGNGGNSADDGTLFTNRGTLNITGDFDAVNNADIVLRNEEGGTVLIEGAFTMNHQSGAAGQIYNNGLFTINGAITHSARTIENDVLGRFFATSTYSMFGGNGGPRIINRNYFEVETFDNTHEESFIDNFDSLIVNSDYVGAIVFINHGAASYFFVGGNFRLPAKTNRTPRFTNNGGYAQIVGDFTVEGGNNIDGTNDGQICIGGFSRNDGTVSGDIIICDQSAFDAGKILDQEGVIANSVTGCNPSVACNGGGGGGGPEICDNNIDDDNDNLIDCADPDCLGLSGDSKDVTISSQGGGINVDINN